MSKTNTVTPKLKPKMKEKWLAALRSGNYKQGKVQLHDHDLQCYCCLGVAGDVMLKDKVKGVAEYDLKQNVALSVEMSRGLFGTLRNQENEDNSRDPWVEVKIAEKHLIPGTTIRNDDSADISGIRYIRISTLNDRIGLSFEVIANIIEEAM